MWTCTDYVVGGFGRYILVRGLGVEVKCLAEKMA